MSWREMLMPARQPSRQWAPSAALETEARDSVHEPLHGAGAGRVDFSGVRLHADSEAHDLAEGFGARSFTYGRDVFFGSGEYAPQSEAGGELLAHELNHVAQQSEKGTPALQFQPKSNKAGIGAEPPDEYFVRDPDNWGAEDKDVLFDGDGAALDGGDEKTIREFSAQQSQPVYVHIHGYASQEGPGEYNLNLSAHRAVAVKRLLESLLPQGSRVVPFAHGESRHFGAAESNRRAGISLIGPATSGFVLSTDPLQKHHLGEGRQAGALTPPTVPFPPPVGGLPPPSVVLATPSPYLAGPPLTLTPRRLMDNAGLLAPSSIHGVSPSTTGNVVEQWDQAYWKYHRLGIPDELKLGPLDLGAGALANKEVTNTTQAYHERNDPTIIEKSNAEVGAHVITSPNLLDLWPKKKTDRKDAK